MPTVARTLLVVASPTATFSAEAVVHSPRVLSPHNADMDNLKTFAEFDRWRDLSGGTKVPGVFKHLTDRHTGIHPTGFPA